MFDKSYVRNLSDTIIKDQLLSYDQLFFLVNIVDDYLYDHDHDCYDDFHRAKLSLLDRIYY